MGAVKDYINIALPKGRLGEKAYGLLKNSGFAQLYVKDRRDAIIIYGLANSLTLKEVNERLFAENEATLC